jgi:hypothetical protein
MQFLPGLHIKVALLLMHRRIHFFPFGLQLDTRSAALVSVHQESY